MRKLLVIILLLAGVGVRLYRLGAPVADWHSWRQADTASVLREFLRQGLNPLVPRYHDLSNIPSGLDNPEGYRMVEFPLYQIFGFILVKIMPAMPIEVSLRLVTVFASVLTGFFLYRLVKTFSGEAAAVLSLAVYLFLPFSVFYGRAILPDPLAVCFSVAAVYFTERYLNAGSRKKLYGFLAPLAALSAILVKPVSGFIIIPVAYLFFFRTRLDRKRLIYLSVFALIALFPFFWWRTWIARYPSGIAVFSWLFNESGIRFKGAWFHWLFAERLGKLILGYYGIFPFLLGILEPPGKKEGWFFRISGLGALSYLVVVAQGNVQHDYYQIFLLPAVAVFLGKGLAALPRITRSLPVAVISGIAIMALAGAFSWYWVRGYYWINRPEIVEAGQAADRLLPPDARVIAPYGGDTTFLYQTKRTGWPIGFEIDKKISLGATHYVTVSPADADAETRDLAGRYRVLIRNERYAIIDLTEKK